MAPGSAIEGGESDWRSMGDLGMRKGQIMRQAAEDALTFHCWFWSQKKGRELDAGSSRLWCAGSTSDPRHLLPGFAKRPPTSPRSHMDVQGGR